MVAGRAVLIADEKSVAAVSERVADDLVLIRMVDQQDAGRVTDGEPVPFAVHVIGLVALNKVVGRGVEPDAPATVLLRLVAYRADGKRVAEDGIVVAGEQFHARALVGQGIALHSGVIVAVLQQAGANGGASHGLWDTLDTHLVASLIIPSSNIAYPECQWTARGLNLKGVDVVFAVVRYLPTDNKSLCVGAIDP